MIIVDFLSVFLILLTIYLFIQVFKSALLFVYLFQLKEYRFDRIKAHFMLLSGRQQLIDNFNLLKWKNFFYPKLTLRSFVIIFFTFSLQYNFFFNILPFIYIIYYSILGKMLVSIVLSLFLVIWLTPVFSFLASLITSLILFPIIKMIYYLALEKRKKYKNLIVVGITGSYGKTATKEILSEVIKKEFKIIKTPFNCNTQLGIALFMIRKLSQRHQVFVVEIGAYKKGEVKEICHMVRPKIGIITGINEQHLELFGSLKNIINGKYELIKSLPQNGLAVFNGKNKYTLMMSKRRRKNKKVYGRERVFYKTGLKGNWYQEPIQAALLVGKYLGCNKRTMVKQLKKIKQLPLAIEVAKGKKGIRIIDDSYSSNPTGFEAALKLVKNMRAANKILITPGIIELGAASFKIHQELGKKSARVCKKIILTKKDFLEPFQKGVKKIMPRLEVKVEENPQKLIEKISKDLNKKSVILLEGRVTNKLKFYLLKK